MALWNAAPAARAGSDFNDWADRFAADWTRTDPSLSTITEYLPAAEQRLLDRQLSSFSAAARARRVQVARRGLAELQQFPLQGLDAQQRISAQLIRWELEDQLRAEAHEGLEHPFNQMSGAHLSVVEVMTRFHPMRDRGDVDTYLARLAQVGARLDEATARAAALERQGHRMPGFILRAVLGQLERFLAAAPQDNVLVASLRTRAAQLPDTTEAERADWLRQATARVEQDVLPAYRRTQALLQSQLPKATDQAGLAWRPGGQAAYAMLLRRFAGASMSAEDIHALGLREVGRIERQMDALLRKLGHAEGSLDDRLEALNRALQPLGPGDPRPGIIRKLQAWVDDATARSAAVFDLRPRAACLVVREPAITEATAAARYTAPAADGSRPGQFWVPLPGPEFRMIEMRSLAYHEAVPGHHFQVALAKELATIPKYRRSPVFGFHAAYAEGWGLYAEQLAVELGWYEGDDVGLLGQLNSQRFRAKRLVVDTGLHAFKWTRQQVIDYGISASEADRYVVWPGQATSYMIGLLRILQMRQKAQAALGDRFDLKQFHNVVLAQGRLPMDVLEAEVERWAARRG